MFSHKTLGPIRPISVIVLNSHSILLRIPQLRRTVPYKPTISNIGLPYIIQIVDLN